MTSNTGRLDLGPIFDPTTGKPGPEHLHLDPRDLTTHGLIVGMTGSGKTGLAVVMIEELLRSGVPVLILDPKGEMGNLALNFPDLAPGDFAPWVDEGEARRRDMSAGELADQMAADWRNGLAGSGLGPQDMQQLKDSTRITIYTPGSRAGVPLNVAGSLRAPAMEWEANAELLRDEVEGYVAGLLALVGLTPDPIASREHILLSNLIENAWANGRDLDLASLIDEIRRPPIRKLGVFELDTFFPEKDRLALAMRLNGLVAAPSFAGWLAGPPIDIGAMLRPEEGRTRGAIIYMAHLTDAERQFVVTLVLAKAVTWVRSLPGTSELKAVIYIDEALGLAPPTAAPPSKPPILTILKQARAHGVGMVVATQNPVDVDYKAMANAGSWFIGRLQTERDKARLADGLSSARGDLDVAALNETISGLQKRQFLLQSAHRSTPILFTTRWAMSFLRGPMTRDQVAGLQGDSVPEVPAAGPVELPGADETRVAPPVAAGIPVRYLDPAAPWAATVGAVPGSNLLEAAVAARVQLLYDDTAAGIDHRETWEAVVFPLDETLGPENLIQVDYDERDLIAEGAPARARYMLPNVALDKAAYFKRLKSQLVGELHRGRAIEVQRNRQLKLYSRVGESPEEFAERCRQAADEEADREAAKLRDKVESQARRLQSTLASAEQKAELLETDVDARRQQEMLGGAGALLGALLGGRSTSSKISRAARALGGASSRRSVTSRTSERLDAARQTVRDKAEELVELEERVVEQVAEIHDKWMEAAAAIEPLSIGLEKSDIDVDELTLVWVGVAESR